MNVRVVLDTNVILAGKLAKSPTSPNREILERWVVGEFDLPYSTDTINEYIEKLLELGVPRHKCVDFVRTVILLGQEVKIERFHYRVYPSDPDDIQFFLCATNGDASHLVTYDSDFDRVRGLFAFLVCDPVEFLKAIR